MDTRTRLAFNTGYFDPAISRLDQIIERAERDLKDVEFDTIVGTGFSGGVVIPALAMWLDVDYLLVRKDEDTSHHSGRVLGTLGRRWLFVDDFVSTGATRSRVLSQVSESLLRINQSNSAWGDPPFTTDYVGDYLYMDALHEEDGFKPRNLNMQEVTIWEKEAALREAGLLEDPLSDFPNIAY